MHPELPSFLDYLDRVHARTRRVVDCIPADGLEWSPGPDRWTAGDQVRHLAAIERWMYAETVCERPSRYAGHGRELVDGLAATIAHRDAGRRAHHDVEVAARDGGALLVVSSLGGASLPATLIAALCGQFAGYPRARPGVAGGRLRAGGGAHATD